MISRSTHLVFFSLETQIAQRVVALLKVNVSKWNVVSHFGSTSLRVCSPQTHCVFVARKHKISPTGIAQPLVQISVWCGSSEVGGRSTDRAPSLFPSWCCSPSHDCHDITTIWKNQQLYLYPPTHSHPPRDGEVYFNAWTNSRSLRWISRKWPFAGAEIGTNYERYRVR